MEPRLPLPSSRKRRPVSTSPPSPSDLRRLASNFFPVVHTLSDYASLINASLPSGIPPIALLLPGESTARPSYASLVSRVLVCLPDATNRPAVPDGVEEGLQSAPGFPRLEDVIGRVISDTLTRHPRGFDAANRNVLCNGFALARPGGAGSVFRNLDARAPSSAVNAFLSAPWRRVFERLGYVAARHLLSCAALVLCVPSDLSEERTGGGEVAMMQLCGPHREKAVVREDSSSIVHLKRQVLYHGSLQLLPHHLQSGKDIKAGEGGAKDPPLNSGLPPSHPMQPLRPGEADVSSRLACIIFPSLFTKQKARLSPRPTSTADQTSRPRKRRRVLGSAGTSAASAAANRNQSVRSISAPSPRFPRRLQKLAPLLEDVVARCAKRSFRALLSETCPLDVDDNPRRSKRLHTCQELSQKKAKPGSVARFLVRAVRQAVPLAIFGSHGNRALFESALHAIIRHRNQHDAFDLQHFLAQQGMKVTEVTWLYRICDPNSSDGRKICNPTDLKYRQARLAEMTSWLFRGFCLPLLRHNFYVTETEVSRNRVVYYRREVWSALTDATLDAMLRSDHHQFSMLTPKSLAVVRRRRESVVSQAGTCFSSAPVFAFSSVRFVPKPSGARGIQRRRAISFRSFVNSKNGLSLALPKLPNPALFSIAKSATKTFYANVQEIVGSETKSNSNLLGASVFTSTDIYQKYAELVSRWRAAGRPVMYFLCMDITRSFDTVPLRSLLGHVLPSIFQREEYVILRYVVVKRSVPNGALVYRYRYYACEEMGEESNFPRLLRTKLAARHRCALYVDLCDVTRLKRGDLLRALEELLGNNIVSIPRRNRRHREAAYAIQCQGLPQGLPLSGILTSLFYGHVESKDLTQFLTLKGSAGEKALRCEALSGVNDESETRLSLQLFMRQVDDTIFASADKDHARRFAERMTKGWDEEHGFVINPTKTRSNFDAGVGGKTGMRFIPWCGYIIDTKTMEVRNDYDRYVTPGFRLRDTLSILYGTGSVRSFSAKALTCFKPKLHPILFDSNINSKRMIALNLYQAAVLSALKLCSYASALFANGEAKPDPNTRDLFRGTTVEMLRSFCTLVTLAVTSTVASRNGVAFPLEDSDVLYLAHRGIYDVLQRRTGVWFADRARAALEVSLLTLRYVTTRGAVQDLAATHSAVLCISSNRVMWSIRL